MGTLNCANIITNNMDVNGTLEVDALSGLNQGFQLGSFQNSNRPTGVSAGTIIWNDEEEKSIFISSEKPSSNEIN